MVASNSAGSKGFESTSCVFRSELKTLSRDPLIWTFLRASKADELRLCCCALASAGVDRPLISVNSL